MRFRAVALAAVFVTAPLALFTQIRPSVALSEDAPNSQDAPPWEYTVRSFATHDADRATATLNALGKKGWEYVGPLANGLVAFRRADRPPAGMSPAAWASTKEAERFQGRWSPYPGKEDHFLLGDVAGDTLDFHDEVFLLMLKNELVAAGRFQVVDASSTPKQIDFHISEGRHKGRHFRAVYRLDPQQLTLCSDRGDDQRPKAFSGTGGSSIQLRK
jgi:uncharacterized protein (TIGR03067 family)